MRCSCGRDTRVATSNLTSLDAPPLVADPPDPTVPVGPTSCWLSVGDENGPDTGCTPDSRTYDVLERRRRGWKRPAPVVNLVPTPVIVIPDEDRAAFAALQFQAQAVPKAKAPARAQPPTQERPPARAAMKAQPTPPAIAKAPAVLAPTKPAPPEEPVMLSLFG